MNTRKTVKREEVIKVLNSLSVEVILMYKMSKISKEAMDSLLSSYALAFEFNETNINVWGEVHKCQTREKELYLG